MKEHKDILYSKGNNDECYTPRYGVTPLLEFLEDKKDKIIWCPFDTEESSYVKVLSEKGFKVVYSHINNKQDFFDHEPDNWDILISNPPFTNKKKFFERALSFGKPFALLMTNVWLNDTAPLTLFGDALEILFLKGRIEFISPDGVSMGRPSFSSSYYCYNFLPRAILCRDITVIKEDVNYSKKFLDINLFTV